jgi:5,5'-dehydrodivanillate O-demethylase oxygenase subunit
MLDASTNRLLTQVGPGTPMGGLLRRYWHPIAGAGELDREPVKAVRLMGEDLVLYRDLGGRLGLVGRRCLHRGADLLHGIVERRGLRCHYHGWLYDESGRCAQQPFEEVADPGAASRKRPCLPAYPVDAKAGMIWAYLGPPDKQPLLPDWEPFSWRNGFAQVVLANVSCNWLQCQENSIDPVHFEWAHSNSTIRRQGADRPYSPRHLKLGFEEFEYGFVYKRVREDTSENHPLWTVGRVCLWPNAFFLGDHFEWRVPVDDENTLSVTWAFTRVPKECEPYEQKVIPSWHGPTHDREGRWITSHVMNQDFAAWAGQGRIADRTCENLRLSDRGIVLLRKRFLTELERSASGDTPKGLIYDPVRNRRVALPVAMRNLLVEGLPRREMAKHPVLGRLLEGYVFQAGQPPRVRRAFLEAMRPRSARRRRAA